MALLRPSEPVVRRHCSDPHKLVEIRSGTVADQADQPSLQLTLLPSLRLADTIDLRPPGPIRGSLPPGLARRDRRPTGDCGEDNGGGGDERGRGYRTGF
jgi:hypothetical protein